MMRRTASSKPPKPPKVSKNQEGGCSRVGSDFQVSVPEYVYSVSDDFRYSQSSNEINMWHPAFAPSESDVEYFCNKALAHSFSQEAARVFLHYHEYDTYRASIDLANYHPILNKWTKREVKKFLKCVDGRPRKDFVNVKRSFPAYQMGEVAALYYGIAAPFKSTSRHSKKHAQKMQACFEKAIKAGFVTVVNRSAFHTTEEQLSGYLGPECETPEKAYNFHEGLCEPPQKEEIDPLDAQLEQHLVDMLGEERTKRALNGMKCGRPSSLFMKQSMLRLDALSSNSWKSTGSNGSDGQLGGSDYSSVCEGDHNRKFRSARFQLPTGIHYDHDEFVNFMDSTPVELEAKRTSEIEKLQPLDEKVSSLSKVVLSQSQSILEGLEEYFPPGGFPKVSYRWTRTELALFLTALLKHGDDFEAISRTLGTKTASFIEDFYHQFNAKLGFNNLCRRDQVKLEEQPLLSPQEENVEVDSPLGQQRKPTNVVMTETQIEVPPMTAISLTPVASEQMGAGGPGGGGAKAGLSTSEQTKEKRSGSVAFESGKLDKSMSRIASGYTKGVEEDVPKTLENGPSVPKVPRKSATLGVDNSKNSSLVEIPKTKRGRPRKYPITEDLDKLKPTDSVCTSNKFHGFPAGRGATGRGRGKRGRPPLRL